MCELMLSRIASLCVPTYINSRSSLCVRVAVPGRSMVEKTGLFFNNKSVSQVYATKVKIEKRETPQGGAQMLNERLNLVSYQKCPWERRVVPSKRNISRGISYNRLVTYI